MTIMKTVTYDDTKFALVPREATYENGMKGKFIGEFTFCVNVGSFNTPIETTITIPWTDLKHIYREMVKFSSDVKE